MLAPCSKEGRKTINRENYAALFDKSPNFIGIVEGADHRFVFVNAHYVRVTGGRELLGRTVNEALPDGVAQGYLALLNQVYTSGSAMVLKGSRYDVQPEKDGPIVRRLYLDIMLQPVIDESGRTCGILIEGSATEVAPA